MKIAYLKRMQYVFILYYNFKFKILIHNYLHDYIYQLILIFKTKLWRGLTKNQTRQYLLGQQKELGETDMCITWVTIISRGITLKLVNIIMHQFDDERDVGVMQNSVLWNIVWRQYFTTTLSHDTLSSTIKWSLERTNFHNAFNRWIHEN